LPGVRTLSLCHIMAQRHHMRLCRHYHQVGQQGQKAGSAPAAL
jgi:hypothetical protein